MQFVIGFIFIVLIVLVIRFRRDANRWLDLYIELKSKQRIAEQNITVHRPVTTVQVLFTDLEEIEVIVVNNKNDSVGWHTAEYLGIEPKSGFIGYALDMATARKHGDTFRYRKIYRLKDGRVISDTCYLQPVELLK